MCMPIVFSSTWTFTLWKALFCSPDAWIYLSVCLPGPLIEAGDGFRPCAWCHRPRWRSIFAIELFECRIGTWKVDEFPAAESEVRRMEPVRVGPGLWALSRSLMRLPVPKLVLSFTENYNSDAGPENGDPFLSLLCLSNLLSSISFNLLKPSKHPLTDSYPTPC